MCVRLQIQGIRSSSRHRPDRKHPVKPHRRTLSLPETKITILFKTPMFFTPLPLHPFGSTPQPVFFVPFPFPNAPSRSTSRRHIEAPHRSMHTNSFRENRKPSKISVELIVSLTRGHSQNPDPSPLLIKQQRPTKKVGRCCFVSSRFFKRSNATTPTEQPRSQI